MNKGHHGSCFTVISHGWEPPLCESRLNKELLSYCQENCLCDNTIIDLITKYKMAVLYNT